MPTNALPLNHNHRFRKWVVVLALAAAGCVFEPSEDWVEFDPPGGVLRRCLARLR